MTSMGVRLGVAAFLLSLPALPAAGWGQLAPSPDAPPVSTAPAPSPEEESGARVKIEVNLVDVFFTVKDQQGNLVAHLTGDDCTVTEDKAAQKLKSFTAETNLPLTLGILLDTSGSQQRVLPLEQQAGSRFLERILKPKDEAFLISFDVNVDLLDFFRLLEGRPYFSMAMYLDVVEAGFEIVRGKGWVTCGWFSCEAE